MQRYGKVIKFLGRFFWVIFLIFSVLLVTIYFGIRSYSVQTWAAQKAAESLSKELKTKVTMEGLEIDLFSRLKLKNVFLADSLQDTLLHAKVIEIKLNYLSLSKTTVSIKSILISDATVTLKKYKSPRRNNFDFIANYFSPKKKVEKETSQSPWKIIPGQIILNDVDFNYLDEKYADRTKENAINYNYIKTKHVSGIISQIKIAVDSISANIKNLSALERSGIVLKTLNTTLLFLPKQLVFDSLEIASNDSKYFGRASFDFDSFSDFQDDFEGKVYMRYRIDSSLVYSKDISFYAPELKGMDLSIQLKGDLRGKVDNLKGKNIVFDYGKDTHFDGNISFENLTHADDLYMHIKANDLTTSKQDLENIPLYPFIEKEKISLPKEIAALGKIKFKGVYDGFIEDFSIKGKAMTDAGSADVNIAIELPNGKTKNMTYDGVIATSDFSISKFLKLPFAIDNISSKINLKGKGLDGKNANIVFEGELLNITYNNYQ
jgi:hypothetical protein